MVSYELYLKNQRRRTYHAMGWIIVLLNVIFIVALTFTKRFESDRFYGLFLLGIILIVLIVGRIKKFNLKGKNEILFICNAMAIGIWFKWGLYWMAGLILVIMIFHEFATRKLKINISPEAIRFPSIIKRTVQWDELSNIILKDGLLTIDFKNNKLVQGEIEGDDFINEQEFNEFCSQQLKK